MKCCSNCGKLAQLNGGRCTACRSFFYRHSVERPAEFVNRQLERAANPRWCKVCGNPKIIANCRCNACDHYWRAHGKERPYRYWTENKACKNCKVPLAAVKRKRGLRCGACDDYKRKYGVNRPKYLWGDGVHGFCECGYPADHMIDKFPLCNRCAKEYQSPIVAVAGDAHGGRRGSVRW